MRPPDIFNWGGYSTTGAKRNLTGPTMGTEDALFCFRRLSNATFSQKLELLDSDAGSDMTASMIHELGLISG